MTRPEAVVDAAMTACSLRSSGRAHDRWLQHAEERAEESARQPRFRAWHSVRMEVGGLLLAAGAGRRYGGPKSLVDGWLVNALAALEDGGCNRCTVVLGAGAAQARTMVPQGIDVVVAENWEEGVGASLRAGLAHLSGVDAAMVHLVDLPDVTADVVGRVMTQATSPSTLARAAFAGVPGHPVLIGRDHWAALLLNVSGDTGARDYLAARGVTLVECGDLATGHDVDS